MPPEDKTIVRESVSESDKLDKVRSEERDPSLKDPAKQSWENQAKEYQRKHEALSEKYDVITEEIAELREKLSSGDGTRADRVELDRLKSKKDAIQEAKEKIMDNPDSKPWLSLTEEISTRNASQKAEDAIYQYDYRQALKEVKKAAKGFEVDAKNFENELFEILKGGRWEFDTKGNRVMPTERIENAIDEWSRINDLKKTAKKGEEKEVQFAEKGGRTMQRNPSKLEELKDAKDSGKFANILAKKAGAQQEYFK